MYAKWQEPSGYWVNSENYVYAKLALRQHF
jgi:hypothetical protein